MQIKLKSKGFLCFVVVLCLGLVFLLLMYQMGFRITYAPDLESSWDAISGTASWVSVIVSVLGVIASFLAVWSAIQVPKKIAERQIKVDLFEKRYRVYRTLILCDFFSSLVYISKEPEDIKEFFYKSFHDLSESEKMFQYNLFAVKYIQVTENLAESKFLFSEDVWKGVYKIVNSVQNLVETVKEGMSKEEFDKAKQDYLDAMKSCELKLILNKMEEELNLTKF